eukprot:SAG31_NODE_24623_length_477_cov_1.648148_1_plen_138_part_10
MWPVPPSTAIVSGPDEPAAEAAPVSDTAPSAFATRCDAPCVLEIWRCAVSAESRIAAWSGCFVVTLAGMSVAELFAELVTSAQRFDSPRTARRGTAGARRERCDRVAWPRTHTQVQYIKNILSFWILVRMFGFSKFS